MEVNMYPSSNQSSNNNPSTANNILGKDDFLKLLISQLQNQNPLDPVDDKEFIAQMAQFSSLEQIQNMSENIEKLVLTIDNNFDRLENKISDINSFRNKLSNVSLIGKKVNYTNSEGISKDGIVTSVSLNDQKIIVDDNITIELTDIEFVNESNNFIEEKDDSDG